MFSLVQGFIGVALTRINIYEGLEDVRKSDCSTGEILGIWGFNMSTKNESQTVPLSVLLKRELANEKIEKPDILYGQASQSKKGEDFTLLKIERQRVLGDGVTTYSVFAVSFCYRISLPFGILVLSSYNCDGSA